MPFELKPISKEAIPAAIEKVHRYRLLNEPAEAESICLDILQAEPENQGALVLLALSRSDQIDNGMNPAQAREPLRGLTSPYEAAYYGGIISERTAKAILQQGRPNCGHAAYEHLMGAMECFEEAERLRPADNDDAILRYNACVRFLKQHPQLQPRPLEVMEAVLGE